MSGDQGFAVMDGAEPFSAPGGPDGALVLHGFTGSPQSMRPLARAFAAAGLAVECPLLPGHGTSVEDLARTGWDDWSQAAQLAYVELQSRCRKVVVAGLSGGGTIACWLAACNPEIAGLIAINPQIDPPAESFREVLRQILATGTVIAPAIGNDIADPDQTELAYDGVALPAALSLFEGLDGLFPMLGEIRCPTLVMTSRADHVVPPVSSDLLAERVSGPVERVFFERSYHVVTLDYDKDELEARAVEFARKVAGV